MFRIMIWYLKTALVKLKDFKVQNLAFNKRVNSNESTKKATLEKYSNLDLKQ